MANTKGKEKSVEAKNLPEKINVAGSHKRFIDVDIDVTKIDKSYLFMTEPKDGKPPKVYLKATLMMMPDGEVDNYGNLGMIVQKVPKEVYEKDNTKKGEILGNCAELRWNKRDQEPSKPVSEIAGGEDFLDDLPF